MDWFRLTKFYRGMPELDRYTDKECRKLVARARQRRGDAIWIVPWLAGVLAAAVWIAAGIGIFSVATAVLSTRNNSMAPKQWGGTSNSTVSTSTMLSFTNAASDPGLALKWGLTLVFSIFVYFATYVLVKRIMLVRSIRNIVNKAGCPYCGFSLVGLTVKTGAVQCPECGQKVWLHEQRLSPEDLLPDTPGARNAAADEPVGAGPMGAYKGKRRREAEKAPRG